MEPLDSEISTSKANTGLGRSRSSRGDTPAPLTSPIGNPPVAVPWTRKVAPVIGLRDRNTDPAVVAPSVNGNNLDDPVARCISPDQQSSRTRTLSNINYNSPSPFSHEDNTALSKESVQNVGWSSTEHSSSTPTSVRLGVHQNSQHTDPRKSIIAITDNKDISSSNTINLSPRIHQDDSGGFVNKVAADSSPKSDIKRRKPVDISIKPENNALKGRETPQLSTQTSVKQFSKASTPSPALHSSPSSLSIVSQLAPNRGEAVPILSLLFEQTHSLLDQGLEDWALSNYEQLRHVISQLFHSADLIKKMVVLVKRIAPIFINRHQEREATNRYKEVMYLAEKIGFEAVAEQIELNLLVADSYILRSELAITDLELAVNVAAYANEAMWLSHTYKVSTRLDDCRERIDLAEAVFASIFLINTNVVLRLNQVLTKRPQDFPKVFRVVERTLHQLFKNKRWQNLKRFYQSGILECCTLASQRLNDESYLMKLLLMQTMVNQTMLSPSITGTKPESNNGTANTSTTSNSSQIPSTSIDSLLPASFMKLAPNNVTSNWTQFRTQLQLMRDSINVTELSNKLLNPEYVQSVQNQLNTQLVELIKSVFDYCVEMVGDPPCPFSVFGLGSLSRFEAGPYSDLEYGFLLGEESKRESSYWKDLWTIFEFTFICFGERVGLHTDDQGSPKTPTFRGTPAQLLDLFLHPLDAHDISTAFSMLRPLYISSYPQKTGRELHDTYINLVNHILVSSMDSVPQHTKIGSLFLDDHASMISKWTPKESDCFVELKTHFIQPLVYLVTDIALASGCYIQSTVPGVVNLVDLLTQEDSKLPTSISPISGTTGTLNTTVSVSGAPSALSNQPSAQFAVSFSQDFTKSIKTIFLACYGLKILAQLHYHEQFEGDRVSITDKLSTFTSNDLLHSKFGSAPSSGLNDVPYNGGIYQLTRDQVYWLKLAETVVIKPLYGIVPQLSAHFQSHPSPEANSSTLSLQSFNKIDPVIDAASELLDPKFDLYSNPRTSVLEETKDLIRRLVATLIFRDSPIPKFRQYYKLLSSDFKLLYRAAVTQHAVWQASKVQILSSVFDSYASADGSRPLIERLKAHWKDHINVMDQKEVSKIIAQWDPKGGPYPIPLRIRLAYPTGWPSQSRLKVHGNEPYVTSMKPLSASKNDGNIGFELVLSLLHLSCIGFGAPMLEMRSFPASNLITNQQNTKDLTLLYTESMSGDPLAWSLSNDPNRIKNLDAKSFTEIAFINMLVMCNAHAEDFLLEPISDDPRAALRLQRTSFAGETPQLEPITISTSKDPITSTPKEVLQLKVFNIIFCMPNMMQHVNPVAVEDFCSLSPVQLMSRLVQELDTFNREWKARIDAPTISALNRYVDPPPAPGTTSVINVPQKLILVIYDRMVRLQRILVDTPKATHLDILKGLDPIIGHIYGEALQQSTVGTSANSNGPPASIILPQTSSNTNISDIIDRLKKIESKKEFPIQIAYAVPSSSPKTYNRLEQLRRASKFDSSDSSVLPSTDSLYEKSDAASQKSEVKQMLLTMNHTSFPREEIFARTPNVKEQLLCSIDFGQIDTKKQRQSLLGLYDNVKFTSHLRIRHCPELDHQRLARILSGDTMKQLVVLDLRGMVGLKQPTLALIAGLDNLEYLNISETDLKGVSTEKFGWVKREAVVMERLVILNLTKSAGLQHVLLRAPNLRHIDISNCPALNEIKIWSSQRVSVLGLGSQQVPGGRLFNEVLSTSWWYTPDAINPQLEKQLLEVSLGREKTLSIHGPMSESTAKVVAEVIKFAPALEIVDLSKSTQSGGDDQVESIINAVVSNPLITSLDMSGCGIKASKIPALVSIAAQRLKLKAKFS